MAGHFEKLGKTQRYILNLESRFWDTLFLVMTAAFCRVDGFTAGVSFEAFWASKITSSEVWGQGRNLVAQRTRARSGANPEILRIFARW